LVRPPAAGAKGANKSLRQYADKGVRKIEGIDPYIKQAHDRLRLLYHEYIQGFACNAVFSGTTDRMRRIRRLIRKGRGERELRLIVR